MKPKLNETSASNSQADSGGWFEKAIEVAELMGPLISLGDFSSPVQHREAPDPIRSGSNSTKAGGRER